MHCPRCGQWAPETAGVCGHCGAPLSGAGGPPDGGARSVAAAALPAPQAAGRYAGFWRRFFAGLVDFVVLVFPLAIARELMGMGGDNWTLASQGQMLGQYAFQVALGWLYCALLESSASQGTLGQQLLDLRVTDAAGRRISFLRATGRHFAQWLSVLICGIGYLVNLWTQRRQTLHDLVAGCVIVRPAPRETAPAPGAMERS